MAHGHEPKLQHAHHHGPKDLKTYMVVFALLLIGMVATIVVYYAIPNLGDAPWVSFANNAIAMLIAVAKASLVVAYFMGVKFTTRLVQLFALLGFVWVTLMTFVLCDYATRHTEPAPGWEVDERPAKWLGGIEPRQDDRPYDPPLNQK